MLVKKKKFCIPAASILLAFKDKNLEHRNGINTVLGSYFHMRLNSNIDLDACQIQSLKKVA